MQQSFNHEVIAIQTMEKFFAGEQEPRLLDRFRCHLCLDLVYKPVKCAECEAIFCRDCVKLQERSLRRGPRRGPRCCPECGTEDFQTVFLTRDQRESLGNLEMRCPNAECEAQIRYQNMISHLKKRCEVKTYKTVLMNNFVPQSNDDRLRSSLRRQGFRSYKFPTGSVQSTDCEEEQVASQPLEL